MNSEYDRLVDAKRSLERERDALMSRRDRLNAEKAGTETRLSEIGSQIRQQGRMDRKKYVAYCETQDKLKRQRVATERDQLIVKEQIRTVGARLEELADQIRKHHQSPESAATSGQATRDEGLLRLIGEYKRFAADGSRISSKRQMAAEFVLRLEQIAELA